jgi:hypothetical protein
LKKKLCGEGWGRVWNNLAKPSLLSITRKDCRIKSFEVFTEDVRKIQLASGWRCDGLQTGSGNCCIGVERCIYA